MDAEAGERLPLVDKENGTKVDRETCYSSLDCGFMGFWDQLSRSFGTKVLTLIFLVQHLLAGASISLSRPADPYLFRAFGVPAPEMQSLFVASHYLPLSMKPVIGLISDVFPIFGYNKAPYFLIVSALGSVSFLMLGISPSGVLTLNGVVLCMFLCRIQVSTCDLLTQAKYAEKIQANPSQGPDLLTFLWFGLSAATVFGSMSSGVIIQYLGPNVNYLISAVPAVLVVVPVVLGYLEEKQVTDEELAIVRSRFSKQKSVCVLCLAMLVMAVTLSVSSLAVKSDPSFSGKLGGAISLTMLVSFSMVLSPTLAKFNAFALFQMVFRFPLKSGAFYFYTNTPQQYPEGPHFTPMFFDTVMKSVAGICSLFGIYWYNRHLKRYSYRWLLASVSIVASVLSFSEVVVFTRSNVQLGIPDEAFVLGATALESVVDEWMWMPQFVILAHLCPEGMEATMFSLLGGCHSLGKAISYLLGAWLLDELGVRPSGKDNESAEFNNLWIASMFAGFFQLLTTLLVFWLVPEGQQTERLLADDERIDATAGSLWRRWTGDEEPRSSERSGLDKAS